MDGVTTPKAEGSPPFPPVKGIKAFPLPSKELVTCRRWLGVVWTTLYGLQSQMDGVTTPKAGLSSLPPSKGYKGFPFTI